MSRADRAPHWGLRTLGFLALAAGSLLLAGYFHDHPRAGAGLLTTAGLLTGLAGAAFCSLRGLRSARGWLER